MNTTYNSDTPSGAGTDMSSNLPDTDTVELYEDDDGVDIIHETPNSMLLDIDGVDGHSNVTKNAKNELLYKHGMHRLVHGEPGLVVQFSEYGLIVQTTDEGGVYVIESEEDDHKVHTSPEQERDLLQAISSIKQDDDPEPLINLKNHILDNQVRRYVLNRLFEVPPFSALSEKGIVEQTGRGWLFHDQLLLTWENELLNDSDDTSYAVDGSGTREVSSTNPAFSLTRDLSDDDQHDPDLHDYDEEGVNRHNVEIGGTEFTFGTEEVRFVAKAIWAAKNVRPRGGMQ